MSVHELTYCEYRCDQCQVTARGTDLGPDVAPRGRPEGWTRIRLHGRALSEGLDFCTESCARTFVANNLFFDIAVGGEAIRAMYERDTEDSRFARSVEETRRGLHE